MIVLVYLAFLIIYLFLGGRILYCLFLILQTVCKRIKKLSTKKAFRRSIKQKFITLGLHCIFFLIILFSLNGVELRTKIVNDIIAIQINQKEILDPADYEETVKQNKTQTELSKMLSEGLFGNQYSQIVKTEISLNSLDEYKEFVEKIVNNSGVTPDMDLIEFGKKEEYKYLGKEDIRPLEEIDVEIEEAGAENAPADLYIEEFYARSHAYSYNQTAENAYQTARAADDVINSIAKGENPIDECIYFTTFCVQYYIEALKYELPSYITEADIYLKIAIVLEKVSQRSELEDYENHFLLMTNAFLSLAINYKTEDKLCCEFFNYYYGINLYNLNIECDLNEEELYKKSLEYLNLYLEQSEQREKYTKSCEDYKERIERKLGYGK